MEHNTMEELGKKKFIPKDGIGTMQLLQESFFTGCTLVAKTMLDRQLNFFNSTIIGFKY
jgi:hypothetical protein